MSDVESILRAETEWQPSRGDIVWADVDAPSHSGAAATMRRPVLVVSPTEYNTKTGLALVCPISTHPTCYPFEVVLPFDVGVPGIVIADQVRSIDWRARRATFGARVPPADVRRVCSLIRALVLNGP